MLIGSADVIMKKFVIWLFVVVMAFIMNAVPVLAAVDTPVDVPTVGTQTEIGPRSEETVWYVRYVNGKRQRRLWSITYGEWLTDWLDWPED